MTTNLNLTNHLLIAMPNLDDSYFDHAVIYIAEHSSEGALGVVINQPTEIFFSEILHQMDIKFDLNDRINNCYTVLQGGPIHPERGFVIHPNAGQWKSTFTPGKGINITTSKDILEAIAQDSLELSTGLTTITHDLSAPKDAMVALGYAGWDAGQLESELIQNSWLTCIAEPNLLFDTPYHQRWQNALGLIGIKDKHFLSRISGNA